jgi:hypothetical protein
MSFSTVVIAGHVLRKDPESVYAYPIAKHYMTSHAVVTQALDVFVVLDWMTVENVREHSENTMRDVIRKYYSLTDFGRQRMKAYHDCAMRCIDGRGYADMEPFK